MSNEMADLRDAAIAELSWEATQPDSGINESPEVEVAVEEAVETPVEEVVQEVEQPKKTKSNVKKLLSERNKLKGEAQEYKSKAEELDAKLQEMKQLKEFYDEWGEDIEDFIEQKFAEKEARLQERQDELEFKQAYPDVELGAIQVLREEKNLTLEEARILHLATNNPQWLLDEQERNKANANAWSLGGRTPQSVKDTDKSVSQLKAELMQSHPWKYG